MSTEPTWEQLAVKAKELVADIEKMRKPEPPDKWAECKEAFAQGKVIQWSVFEGDHVYWKDCKDKPLWSENLFYRIRPWSLQPPPFGEWHRQDWREDMLEGGWRPCLKGESHEPGDEVSVGWASKDRQWAKYDSTVAYVDADSDRWFHRTRRPLPPPPDPEREAFEVWARSYYTYTFVGWDDTIKQYDPPQVHGAWLAWSERAKSRS